MNNMDDTQRKCTTFDQIIEPIMNEVTTIEANRTPHHRETLSYQLFVRLLVYYFLTPTESGRQLLTDAASALPQLRLQQVSRSTFFDAFNRFPVEWFQRLLATLLTTTQWASIPELNILGKLYCIDGSIFPALAKMAWATYKKNSQAVKLHLCFELNRMVATCFLVEAGNSSERNALRQMLEANVTYIADRGYVCFNLLADIVTANAHFVMRMKSNLVYVTTQTLPVDLPNGVQQLFTSVTDQLVSLSNADGKPVYRLVTFHVGQESYLILTDRLTLTSFQVILLYAYRWQIELMFRFLKRSLTGLHFLSTSHTGLTIQFYMLLVTALLQLRFKQLCVSLIERSSPHEYSAPSTTDSLVAAMTDPDSQLSSRAQSFLATVGVKLQRYWKISIHWLITLRNYLARPFDDAAIHALGHV